MTGPNEHEPQVPAGNEPEAQDDDAEPERDGDTVGEPDEDECRDERHYEDDETR